MHLNEQLVSRNVSRNQVTYDFVPQTALVRSHNPIASSGPNLREVFEHQLMDTARIHQHILSGVAHLFRLQRKVDESDS